MCFGLINSAIVIIKLVRVLKDQLNPGCPIWLIIEIVLPPRKPQRDGTQPLASEWWHNPHQNATNCLNSFFQNDVDACKGDSGGPLSCNNLLCGIVSFGLACKPPIYNSAYMLIPKYSSWIQHSENFQASGSTTARMGIKITWILIPILAWLHHWSGHQVQDGIGFLPLAA